MVKRNRAVVRRRNVTEERITYSEHITTEQALERVLNIYSSEGYRARTMNDYRKYWAEFIRIIGGDRPAIDVKTDDFRSYINVMLRKRGLAPTTVNIRMNAIRAMFNRLHAEGLIGEENAVAPIRKLKTDESKVGALSDDQVRRLFAQIDKNSFAGYRDYCAMLTMLKCGLRSNEINSLEIHDVDFDNSVIMLPGAKNKNRKNRSIPIHPKVVRELKQLISECQEYFGDSLTYVFVNNAGDKMKEDLIRKRMYKYGIDAGLKGECRTSPHNLRHTFAVNYLKNSGDIRSLMKIMGHSDLSTTQIYLNYSDDDVIEKSKKVNKLDTLDV
ncbi:tyrosine-type recombinase/integrase [Terribacillus saccharophilus]|uniref:DNA integration/recombination/inversion protein n=1 Tax=Terribacillus saccharophilus TaxID=361277 RepID=A0ABX4H0C3_9BACI|nr:tyrosine-type recombinase/integrase [Terribacillus saccharophilus]PAD35953.1 DNA integration/recombination/inversion protein [Terribacillus saccharophilus]PAD96997.1 DNA integration/recombination/inversion protein [Terribacillus saccharophilus]PAE00573.1 DNA integration/recombination/inversion protein [Terribacillus saccharophilus]